MCRMIGFSAPEPIRIGPLVEALAYQAQHGCRPWGRCHEDGWGIVLKTSGGCFWARCDRPVWEFPWQELANTYATAGLLHCRLASPNTPVELSKVHPFVATVGGSTIAFCHNGTIHNARELPRPANTSLPGNAIDTEIYFGYVQAELAAGAAPELAVPRAVERMRQLGANASSLNALCLAGERLVAFRGPVDREYYYYYTLFAHERNGISVVSTEALEGWGDVHLLEEGETLAFEQGQKVRQQRKVF